MDITLTIGEIDLSGKLSKYSCQREVTYPRVITTMDGMEHAVRRSRDVIRFTLFPMTDEEAAALYTALTDTYLSVEYTRPWADDDVEGVCRLVSNLDAVFGIKSINGNRYYKGGEIVLRRRNV